MCVCQVILARGFWFINQAHDCLEKKNLDKPNVTSNAPMQALSDQYKQLMKNIREERLKHLNGPIDHTNTYNHNFEFWGKP